MSGTEGWVGFRAGLTRQESNYDPHVVERAVRSLNRLILVATKFRITNKIKPEVKFQVFKAANTKIAVLWNVKPCSLV